MRVLVTGVDGFVGRHLSRELAEHGHEVVGTVREVLPGPDVPLADVYCGDLTSDWPAFPDIDGVVHLAGLSAVGPSFDRPQEYLETNGNIVLRMAEWASACAPRVRAVVVSSGAVYDARTPGALTERSPLLMSSPYVVSKVLVENLVAYYRERGLPWVIARPFNHIGPGQGEGFLLPDLAVQLIGSVVHGRTLRVGDLTTGRDYTDVRDVARAYRMLLESDTSEHTIFNVCSGRSHTGQELLDLLARSAGLASVDVEVDTSRLRPTDPRTIRGSADRLNSVTGWEPQIELSQCVQDFIESLHESASA